MRPVSHRLATPLLLLKFILVTSVLDLRDVCRFEGFT